MKLDRILPFARTLLEKAVGDGDIAIDATMGNGHDTSYLANLVGNEGKVYSFDIQDQALEATEKRLAELDYSNRVVLTKTGHENVGRIIPAKIHGIVKGAIFNLGYLPGGDKSIVTSSNTTISAVEQIFKMLAPEGIIILVIYHGHEEGATERDELIQFAENFSQEKAHVLQYQFINQKNNPPFIIAIEKR